MNHIIQGRKKPVNLTLNEDLVREARRLTSNLSQTVEDLLSAYVADQQEQQLRQDKGIDAAIQFLNEQYDRHGGIGEEFSPF